MKYPSKTEWEDIPKTRIVCATSDDRKQEYVLYIYHHIAGDVRVYAWEDRNVNQRTPNKLGGFGRYYF